MASLSDVTAAGGAVLGSIVGEFWAQGDEKKRKRLLENAMKEVTRLNVPPLEQQRIKLQLAELMTEGPSAMEGVRVSPFFENIQKQAIESYQEQATGTGVDATGKAALFMGRTEAGQAAAARQGAIRQDARARGIRGSGLDMVAQQINAQQEAQQAAQAGFQASAESQMRREQARMQGAALAGQASDRSFGQQSARAQAIDAVNARNAMATNQNRQFNANTQNQQAIYNSRLVGENYDRQLQLAQAKAMARQGMAGYYDEQANRKRGMATETGRAVGAAAGKAVEMYMSGGTSEMAGAMGGMMGGGGGGGMI